MLKLSTLALIGAVSASDDITALPWYKSTKSAYCKNRINYIGKQVAYYNKRSAKTNNEYYAKYYNKAFLNTIDTLCSETSDGYYCYPSGESNLKTYGYYTQYYLQACKKEGYNFDCNQLAYWMNQFYDWTDRCTDYAGPKYKVMIKFSMDQDGQKEVASELKDVEFEMRALKQSQAAHDVKKSFQAWTSSSEFAQLNQQMEQFSNSAEWKEVEQQMNEAAAALKQASKFD